MSSRAVHLEIAHSLETDTCINAIRRFMARRGPVKSIASDNGTHIVGAEKELREMINKMNQARMCNALCKYGIQWYFTPPSASHFGGVWERIIRSKRRILFSLMKEQACRADDEALSTVFYEAENILNSRPLTVTSTDPNDLLPLTPHMLINPRGMTLESPGVFQRSDTYARRRWKHVQYLIDIFWSRWKKKYLNTLQKRTKWQYEEILLLETLFYLWMRHYQETDGYWELWKLFSETIMEMYVCAELGPDQLFLKDQLQNYVSL